MDSSGDVMRAVYVLHAPLVDTMTDNGVLSFEVDALYTDVLDDSSCDGLATLVIDTFWPAYPPGSAHTRFYTNN